MEHGSWISTTLVYLAAAVLAVPLARLLGLGAIIGYLGAGIVIGPWGLTLVSDPAAILHFAEFGVVLMLFLVGLELEPRRLWAMRRPIFGGGSVQLLGSAALMVAVALVAGLLGHWSGQLSGQLPWQTVLVAALGLAMSSTAIGLGAAGGGHRGADAIGRPEHGAGRLPGRRAAGRKRIPPRTGNRDRALQGPAAGAVFHRRGHEHRL